MPAPPRPWVRLQSDVSEARLRRFVRLKPDPQEELSDAGTTAPVGPTSVGRQQGVGLWVRLQGTSNNSAAGLSVICRVLAGHGTGSTDEATWLL